jgi:hypothetical protein
MLVPDLSDADWLRAQLDAGHTVTDIAHELERTPRAVRMALRRHDIPTPRDRRLAQVPRRAVRRQWRDGAPVAVIAERFGITPSQVEYVCRDLPRRKPVPRRRSAYDELNDPTWLRVELAVGGSLYSVSKQLGCDRSAVRAALRRHSIEMPPEALSPLERARSLDDPAERATAAERLEVEARRIVDEAVRIKVAAQRNARRRDRPVFG